MKKIIVKIPDVLYSRAINGELTDLDTMFICGAVVQGRPLQAELEEIKAEMDEYKEFQDGHFIDASEMKCALMYIINTRLCELKGEQ